MAEVKQFVCDGCQQPATSRRTVVKFSLNDPGEERPIHEFDAHDAYCWSRAYRRFYRTQKEAAVASNSTTTAPKSQKP